MKGSSLLLRTLGTVGATTVLSLLAISFIPLLWGWTPVVISSGSMQPTLQRGTLVVIDSSKTVSTGDVITFDDPNRDGLITHRVAGTTDEGIITKGDANQQVDAIPLTTEAIKGKVRLAVPLIGYPTVAVQDGNAFAIALVLAMVLAIVVLLSPRERVKRKVPAVAIGGVVITIVVFVAVSTAVFSANTSNTDNVFATKLGYQNLIRNAGPIAYFRLGEAPSSPTGVDEMGTTFVDYVGLPTLGFAGAIIGDNNTAMSITGSQRARSPDIPALSFTGPMSVEAWFKPSASQTTNARVVAKYDGSALNYLMAFEGTQKMRFLVDLQNGARPTATSTVSLTDTSRWYHLVGTWDGSAARIYVDGVAVTSSANAGNPPLKQVNSGVGIGAEFGGLIPIKGALDDVSLWNRALSQTEVTQHRNAGLGL